MRDRFKLVALADASPTVASALAAQYGIPATYHDGHDLIESERLDALLICSPHATHAELTLAALDREVNVLVEKPLCISPDDAKHICVVSQQTGLVVQVGYMKRYHPAYEALIDALPGSSDRLRLISVVTYDPSMGREPYVSWNRMIHGTDIPTATSERLRQSERDQIHAALGYCDERTVRAFSYTYLACLIHDINLIHGALNRLGVYEPLTPVAGGDWAHGEGGSILVAVPGGARWHSAWVLLPGISEFREHVGIYFTDSIHELLFPVPYWADAPASHKITTAPAQGQSPRIEALAFDAYTAELEHFHACVVDGVACRTPPEQGARDIELLRSAFLARTDITIPEGATTE